MWHSSGRWLAMVLALPMLFTIAFEAPAWAQEQPPTADEPQRVGQPETVDDLREIERRVADVAQRVAPATVCVRALGGSGSGVVVSEDGLVLTAGHVAVRPGEDVTIIFPDGTTVRGRSLGINVGVDSALLRIIDEGPWPFVQMGQMDSVELGDWVVAMGHPGGYDDQRPVVARLGRVLRRRKDYIQSDCTIIGGDSGGPLFDLEGRVIGIHSRIGSGLRNNYHVPISTYHETWERLLAAEIWNRDLPRQALAGGDAFMGIERKRETFRAVVGGVVPGQAAAQAGVQPDDLILAIDGVLVDSFGDVVHVVRDTKQPGDELLLTVRRDNEELEITLVLGEYQP